MKKTFIFSIPLAIRCALVALCLGFWSGCGGNDGGDDSDVVVPDAFHPDPNATNDDDHHTNTNTTTSTSTKTNSPTSTKTNQPASSDLSKVNLTGNWKRLTAVYRLKHTGASLQGNYVDGVNTNISGKIAGSVSGVNIEMDVIVHYADNPTNDFTAHKSGKITGQNSMRLVVTSSPHYQGQVQDWYR